jgi:hypothetical protein
LSDIEKFAAFMRFLAPPTPSTNKMFELQYSVSAAETVAAGGPYLNPANGKLVRMAVIWSDSDDGPHRNVAPALDFRSRQRFPESPSRNGRNHYESLRSNALRIVSRFSGNGVGPSAGFS